MAPLLAADSTGWVARSWRTENGLPQNTVNTLTQTRDGFLWVGTNAGLARFDGAKFRSFGLQDGLRSVVVMALAEDGEGTLWIGTSGGGLSYRANGRIVTLAEEQGISPGEDVIALEADRDGSLWIGTTKGLARWSGGTLRRIGEAEGLPQMQVRALLQDQQGTLWASVISGGLYRGQGGKFEKVRGTGPVPGDTYCFAEDRDGAFWAGAGYGVAWRWHHGAWQRFGPDDGLPKANIEALAQGPDGTLWAGTRNAGLHHFNGERFVPVTNDKAFASANVRDLGMDREGSMWGGATGIGLHRFSPRLLDYWSEDVGLPPAAVTSAAEDGSGTIWAGTANKGIYQFDGARFSRLEDPVVSADHPLIYCTTATSDGAVWATGEQCLFRLQTGQPIKAFRDPPIRGDAIRALCADGDTLWLGTYYGTLLKSDATGIHAMASGPFPAGITSIVREGADTLWVGTSAGLYRWEQGKARRWNTRDGLLTANIRTLHRDADGTLWIGTLGGGLVRMKEGRFAHITTRHGLIDDVISQIVPDDLDHLWLGSNHGLMRVQRRELNECADGRIAGVHPVVFGRDEGMLNEQCSGGHAPTAFKAKDGRLIFSTAGGLAVIEPRRLQNLTSVAPLPVIDEIRVDQQAHSGDTPLVIPPGKHRLEIDFTAPALRAATWVRFRYRLEGFDRGWVAANGERVAIYDGLDPGRYVFSVAAAAGASGWNEAKSKFAFEIRPPFWQTFGFRFLAAFVIVGLNGGAVWLHLHRKHRRRLAELERTRQQQAELARVGRVSLMGELSASIAHELNQPLAAILSNAQAALPFLNHAPADIEEVRASLRDITDADRRASEIIRRMREMMKKGEAQIEPRDLNGDIEQVLKLLHSDLVARQVTLETQLQPGLPIVWGDHVQLQQVLLNLIVNACDAMQENEPDERQIIVTTDHTANDMVRVSVIDHGPGVPPESMERIFTAFYSTKRHGLGMGLSICRAIVKAHGGQLWAENNLGRGATFHFTLQPGEKKSGLA